MIPRLLKRRIKNRDEYGCLKHEFENLRGKEEETEDYTLGYVKALVKRVEDRNEGEKMWIGDLLGSNIM